MPRLPEIGLPFPRCDSLAKATGSERYAGDQLPADCLWVGARRAGAPHARIRAVDVTEAGRVPGVFKVLTRKDVPGTNRQGVVHKDQPVLAGDKVRHCGEAVALVMAENREALQAGLERVLVDMESLPAVLDPKRAMAKDAPLVHGDRPGGNVLHTEEVVKGDARRALRDCPVIIRGEFAVPPQEHAFIETPTGVAWTDANGSVQMIVSTQAPFRDRFEIGHALGLDPLSIHIQAPYLGGGFGGKDGATVQCLLALAALHAEGRPVKMVWDREETMLAGYKRHAATMRYVLGANADGALRALDCRMIFDTGAYAHLGVEVMALGMEHAGGPYRIPDTRVRGWCVYTNNPVAGAMRGFGIAQANFGIERMMDMLAAKLGLDPLELRLRNALCRGDRTSSGVTLTTSTGVQQCLETIRDTPGWREREAWKNQAPAFKRRGVGVCAVANAIGYGRGLPDAAIAKLELTEKGAFRIYSGVTDMGQGNASAYLQIAGECLCQPREGMEIVQPDTETSLPSGSSTASRTVYTFGAALIKACRSMREKLFHRAAMVLFVDDLGGFELIPGAVFHPPTGREVPLGMLARFLPPEDRTVTREHVMAVAKDKLETGKGFRLGFPHAIFSYASHMAMVEVDELTGQAAVKGWVAATDGGRVINPTGYEQQVQGAVVQGLGYALSEEVLLDGGRLLTRDFSTYIIPTALDAPEIASCPVQTVEHTGPFGMKGVGEVNFSGALPAVAAAVADACGVCIRRGPLTGERILDAMRDASMQGKGKRP